MNVLRRIYKASVFSPITRELVGVRLLVTLFHRGMAVLYFLFAVWGVASAVFGIPSLQQSQGHLWQFVYSLLVFAAAAPAMIGSTFFPRLARLEMYASSSFVSLIVFYIAQLFIGGVLSGDASRPITSILIATIAVFPILDVVFIYLTLVKGEQARQLLKKVLEELARNDR